MSIAVAGMSMLGFVALVAIVFLAVAAVAYEVLWWLETWRDHNDDKGQR